MWLSEPVLASCPVCTKCFLDASVLLGGTESFHVNGSESQEDSQVIRWREITQAILVSAKYFEYVLSSDNQLYLNCLSVS